MKAILKKLDAMLIHLSRWMKAILKKLDALLISLSRWMKAILKKLDAMRTSLSRWMKTILKKLDAMRTSLSRWMKTILKKLDALLISLTLLYLLGYLVSTLDWADFLRSLLYLLVHFVSAFDWAESIRLLFAHFFLVFLFSVDVVGWVAFLLLLWVILILVFVPYKGRFLIRRLLFIMLLAGSVLYNIMVA